MKLFPRFCLLFHLVLLQLCLKVEENEKQRGLKMLRHGQEVVIDGMWYIVDGDEENGCVFVVDRHGGFLEVNVGEIDHVY